MSRYTQEELDAMDRMTTVERLAFQLSRGDESGLIALGRDSGEGKAAIAYLEANKSRGALIIGAHVAGRSTLVEAIQSVLNEDHVLLLDSDKNSFQRFLDSERAIKINPAPIVEPLHYYDSSPSKGEKHHNGQLNKPNRKKNKASRKARKQNRR